MLPGLHVVSAFGDRRLVAPGAPRRAFGVPPGGPFDRLAAALANVLAGRPEGAPILEVALGPMVFEAEAPLDVAVVGGPDGAFALARGERLEVRPSGARAYVAVTQYGATRLLADPPRLGDAPIRVLPGPQSALLDLDRFCAQAYAVGLDSDRVGVRLAAEPMPHGLSLPSEPAVPGAIQVPPLGQPIVLGPDGPTIGGYPKIAVVIDADLDRLARARPGDTLRFELTSLDDARRMASGARAELTRRVAELRAALLDR